MIKKNKKTDNVRKAVILFLAFIVLTIAVLSIDRQPIAPDGSSVGFAEINKVFSKAFGENRFFDKISDIISVIAILIAFAFALLGFAELVTRKKLYKVDTEIIILGVIYAITIALYIAFIFLPINVRPVLEDGAVEQSFPSSHTMTSVCIFLTAIKIIGKYIENSKILQNVLRMLAVLSILTRLLSGTHWFTDIVCGAVLGCALSAFYDVMLENSQK